MTRYSQILSAGFDGVELALPLSVKVGRRVEVLPLGGDGDRYSPSAQWGDPVVSVQVKLRDLAAAEALTPGRQGQLTFTTRPADPAAAPRALTVARAVLAGVETVYEQSSIATAVLTFVALSVDGLAEPFAAEAQP